MTPRRALSLSILVTVAILVAAYCSIPEPRVLTEAPTPTIRVIVLPEQTPTVTTIPFVTTTPTTETVDVLPMVTSTRVPTQTSTPTVAPLAPPTPNTTPPVQRG